uniref:Uncharacterized protein n=1 Tax=Daphnia magna TaxID=35525 RepID=A0A0P6FER7_9CRUS
MGSPLRTMNFFFLFLQVCVETTQLHSCFIHPLFFPGDSGSIFFFCFSYFPQRRSHICELQINPSAPSIFLFHEPLAPKCVYMSVVFGLEEGGGCLVFF